MKFCILASGSKGNAIWVEEGDDALAIDNGLSAKEFKARAALAGLNLEKLSALLVSHEHRDHICGLGPLARALKVPVLANQGTARAAGPLVGNVTWEIFKTGDVLSWGKFKIRTIPVSHDAEEPVAFVVESGQGALGVATDLGASTHLLRTRLKGLRALILEFNHDFRMLMDGPYPWALKQRVRGRYGHLDNEAAAELATELYHHDLKHLILAHLSEVNNHPDLALKSAAKVLNKTLNVVAAAQKSPSELFEF